MKKGDAIYVVGFAPATSEDTGSTGGFDWAEDAETAKEMFTEHLNEDPDMEFAYSFRRIVLPEDFAKEDEVSRWLDEEMRGLWDPAIQSLS